LAAFRFEIGQRVRVVTHPARPVGIVVARWTGEETRDGYAENIYALSSFVTKQRESSLAPAPEDEAAPDPAACWPEALQPSRRDSRLTLG
jgi:hypothetical protein